MKLLIPLILALAGLGGGLAAGHFLRPPPPEAPEAETIPNDPVSGAPLAEDMHEDAHGMTAEEAHVDGSPPPYDPDAQYDYAELDRQFIAPVVEDEKVVALVIITLSVEVTKGMTEEVFIREPKLRDRFLKVLFRHAQSGAFTGAFTAGPVMRDLRGALLEQAQSVLGPVVNDVLITDIMRQDF